MCTLKMANRISLLPFDCRWYIARQYATAWKAMAQFDEDFSRYSDSAIGQREFKELFHTIQLIIIDKDMWTVQKVDGKVKSHVKDQSPYLIIGKPWSIKWLHCTGDMIKAGTEMYGSITAHSFLRVDDMNFDVSLVCTDSFGITVRMGGSINCKRAIDESVEYSQSLSIARLINHLRWI